MAKKAKSGAKGIPSIKASSEARRTACAILEVLAGLRGPGEGAEILSVSLPRYYSLETRALEGLVKALEPRGKGRKAQSVEARLESVCRERDRLKVELNRMRSLVRLSQRAVGIPAQKKETKGGRKKRRTNRTSKVLALLKPPDKPGEAGRQKAGG
jgi:hypothetical protein